MRHMPPVENGEAARRVAYSPVGTPHVTSNVNDNRFSDSGRFNLKRFKPAMELVVREEALLSSRKVTKLMPDATLVVVDETVTEDGTHRARVASDVSGIASHEPIGWVTATKDGTPTLIEDNSPLEIHPIDRAMERARAKAANRVAQWHEEQQMQKQEQDEQIEAITATIEDRWLRKREQLAKRAAERAAQKVAQLSQATDEQQPPASPWFISYAMWPANREPFVSHDQSISPAKPPASPSAEDISNESAQLASEAPKVAAAAATPPRAKGPAPPLPPTSSPKPPRAPRLAPPSPPKPSRPTVSQEEGLLPLPPKRPNKRIDALIQWSPNPEIERMKERDRLAAEEARERARLEAEEQRRREELELQERLAAERWQLCKQAAVCLASAVGGAKSQWDSGSAVE